MVTLYCPGCRNYSGFAIEDCEYGADSYSCELCWWKIAIAEVEAVIAETTERECRSLAVNFAKEVQRRTAPVFDPAWHDDLPF